MQNRGELQQLSDYVNNILSAYQPASYLLPLSADNCVQALHDGVILCYIVNCLSTTGPIIKESQLKKTKATLFHKMDQVNKALDAAKKVGLNIVNVRAEFIVQKKENVIIGLFNQIKRQKPGPKHQNKKPQPQPPQHQQQQIQKQPQIIQPQKSHYDQQTQHNIPPKIQQKPVKPHTEHVPNIKQQTLAIKINQNQHIQKEAQLGYQFNNVVGPQIVVLAGSLRKGSVNKGIVDCLQEIKNQKYFQNIYFHVPDLSILPLLNYDLVRQGRVPKAIHDLRQLVRRSLGLLIATPQYNGTFSGIIKNAFDWLSSSWQNNPSPLPMKKIGITSCSYLTQNPIKDTIEIGENLKCNYFHPSFYLSLREGAINMQTGRLQNKNQIDKLALWYQDYSYFMLSGNPHFQNTPRFIMDP